MGILSMLLILLTGNIALGDLPAVPAGALLVFAWARLSHTPLRTLGLIRPKYWFGTLTCGVVFSVAFKILLKALVMPALGAVPENRTYHFLTGDTAMLPAAVWAMLVAGFGGETVFRGHLFERSARIFGCDAAARAGTVLLTFALFGAAHYADQGLAAAEQGAITRPDPFPDVRTRGIRSNGTCDYLRGPRIQGGASRLPVNGAGRSRAHTAVSYFESAAQEIQSTAGQSCTVEVTPFTNSVVVNPQEQFQSEGMLRIRISHARGVGRPEGPSEELALKTTEALLRELGIKRK
jgi:hypothetical protein